MGKKQKDIRLDIRQDQSFDGIATKFNNNIYGTPKGQLRHAVLTHLLEPLLKNSKPQRILDIGGGTGVMAKTLSDWGHYVDIVDVSSDVLELAKADLCDAIDAGKVQVFCASLQDFSQQENYDVVVCHAVLEWLADPFAAIAKIVSFVKPKGTLSLSFFNKDAKLFSNIAYGNFEYIQNGLKVKNQVRLNPQSLLSLDEVTKSLSKNNCECVQVAGVRCFFDYMKRPLHSDEEFEQLLILEKQYCLTPPFSLLGRYLHVLATPRDAHLQVDPDDTK